MVVDSNIIIGYLSGDSKIIRLLSSWRLKGGFLFIPAVVESEILSYSKLTIKEISAIEQFLEENFIFIPIDRSISRSAGYIRRTFSLKLPDSLIVASALSVKHPLLTRDKDYQKINDLQIIHI